MNESTKPRLYWISPNQTQIIAMVEGTAQPRGWLPAVVVPLTGIGSHSHIEAHSAQFEENGIRVQLRVIAGKAPSEKREERKGERIRER